MEESVTPSSSSSSSASTNDSEAIALTKKERLIRFLDAYFHLTEKQTDVKTEALAGATSFLSIMYMIVVVPAMLGDAGMDFNQSLTATVLMSSLTTFLMGVYANNPLMLTSGLGIGSYFVYTVVIGQNIPVPIALGALFWAGVAFILMSVFRLRDHIVKVIPRELRNSLSVGIGLFIALIGFKNAGFVVPSGATLVTRGKIDEVTITFVIGLGVTSVLIARKVIGGLMISILFTTLLSVPIGRLYGKHGPVIVWNEHHRTGISILIELPDFKGFFQLDLLGALKVSVWPIIISVFFTDMFDSISCLVGVSEAASEHMLDENGDPVNMKQALIVDSIASTSAALFGTTSGTTVIESATGINQGGRTGLTAVVIALLYLPFLFFSPLVSLVPPIATAPTLVMVGIFMMNPVSKIDWNNMEEAIPAFLALVLVPFTFSITQGIVWGFLSWTVLKLGSSGFKDITITLIIVDALAIFSLFF
eukprot:TRINITY_DN4496_c1_g1_i1.p1 TRINITY_DN4496_c1_g1~~TRINITY_DN4496_c1_g1_i1.p1  ORF type:complete len:477 (-),score=88.58 TRINITY_DN4496_c1_g1_i1:37-1467(-)